MLTADLIFNENRKLSCIIDEIDLSLIKKEDLFLKDISENAVFSGLSDERAVVSYFLYSNNVKTIPEIRKNPKIIFLDSEKIIFGCIKTGFCFVQNSNYSIELKFPLNLKGPIKSRTILLNFKVERVFNEEEKSCVVCGISKMKAEDERFLLERR